MDIHFAIQCHNFQQRLCWQLSSISQQLSAHTELPQHQFHEPIPEDLGRHPDVTVDIAYMPDNGYPMTESVIWHFRRMGVNIHETIITDRDLFARRGLVRNIQVENAWGSDWIFFADCDNVYHPHFFCRLARALEQVDGEGCYFSRAKYHTDVKATKPFADLTLQNKSINYSYERACKIPRIEKANKNVAAGCMQVVRTERTGGYYVEKRKCRDSHLFDKGQRARSDIGFRKRMGGSVALDLPVQVHLNHRRDKEEGAHLNVQR